MIQVTHDFSRFERLEKAAGESRTPWQRRILAELRFVAVLSEEDGRYEGALQRALAILEEALDREGVVTNQAAERAEQELMPCAEEAKSYEFLCAAHAHIDMNWMWGFQETVATTVDTFRTMLRIMEEYPEFTFSQSQASVYRLLERFAPEMLEEIRQRVAEGRWELTASAWVETDKNMPSGESLSRHILYTKRYLSRLFGVDPANLDVDFSPDTFGHSENIPEIDRNGGVKYYYHCRGQVGENILCRWRAPSGAEVLLYTEPFWYNGIIDTRSAESAVELARRTGSRTLLKVYGVGDHGGGPTRRDLDRILEMNSWPVYPKFRCATFREYFQLADQRRESLPVVEGERNFLCDGCYTTQSRIKAGNRQSERLLGEAEFFAAQDRVRTGAAYPREILGEAWEKVLFNQFHDIIPGSGVTETREYASGLYQETAAAAETRRKLAIYRMTEEMDTAALLEGQDIAFTRAEGGGAGFGECGRAAGKTRIFHLLQALPWEREETAEFVVWDYEGDENRLCVRTPDGAWIPSQVVEKDRFWDHRFVRLLARVRVPACGSTVYLVGEKPVETGCVFQNNMQVQTPDEFVLENRKLRANFSPEDGALISLVDKKSGRELIPAGKRAGFALAMEADWKKVTGWNGGMSAWFTARHKSETPLGNVEMRMLPGGAIRQRLELKAPFGTASSLRAEIFLDEESEMIQYRVSCDWREFGGEGTGTPCLFFTLPEELSGNQYLFDVPFGFVRREGREMDLPASRFVMAGEDGADALLLTAQSKYGYRCGNGRMAVTLIRGAYDPDPTPEIGKHEIAFAVMHAAGGQSRAAYSRMVQEYEQPLLAVSGRPHPGTLSAEGMFLELSGGPVLLSAIKGGEDGEPDVLFVRLYETEGQACEAVLRCGFDVAAVSCADTLEQPAEGSAVLEGREIRVPMRPYQVLNLRIQVKK